MTFPKGKKIVKHGMIKQKNCLRDSRQHVPRFANLSFMIGQVCVFVNIFATSCQRMCFGV